MVGVSDMPLQITAKLGPVQGPVDEGEHQAPAIDDLARST